MSADEVELVKRTIRDTMLGSDGEATDEGVARAILDALRPVRASEVEAAHRAPALLVELALHLRQFGERAPGGNETWAEFDRRAETFLRTLPSPPRDAPGPGEQGDDTIVVTHVGPDRCGLCGRAATGFASIGDTRYCHGDDDTEPTCYERAQWAELPAGDPFANFTDPAQTDDPEDQ